MNTGQACNTILTGLDGLGHAVESETGAALDEIAARTAGPFAVAVLGRLKAGKSTLVNSLLGHPAAATDVAECTTVVSRYRRGVSDLVVVHHTDGRRSQLPLGRELVPSLAEPDHGIDHLEVTLTSLPLDGIELIDTPGLASLTGSTSDGTEALFDRLSRQASTEADAIVYIFNGLARNDDVEVLRHFLRTAGGRSVASVIGVLNKADQVTGGLTAAHDHATRLSDQLSDAVSIVVPTVALAAQAIRCGFVDSDVLDICTRLSMHPAEERSTWWRDGDLFALLPLHDVTSVERERLTAVTSLHGAESIVEHLAARPGDRAGAASALEDLSGIAEITAALGQLSSRRDALKATHALSSLQRLAWAPTTPPADAALIRRAHAELRDDPALQLIKQLEALDMIAAEPALVTADERTELFSLLGGSAAEADIDAYQAAARWHIVSESLINKTGRRHIASVARSAYQALPTERASRLDQEHTCPPTPVFERTDRR